MLRVIVPLLLLAPFGPAQTVVSVGDSSGEGVHSADVSIGTQLGVYSKLVANQIGAAHPLPLIISNPVGTVFSTFGRFRLEPTKQAHNLAISGADVSDLLRRRPDLPIDSETDLVLMPYSGSQIEIVESLAPDFVLCWIGNNDALGAILAFDELNGTQLTPVEEFRADFREIAQRLSAAGKYVVVGNIPNLTAIAYAMDPVQLAAYAGSDFGLPAGYRTSLVAATVLRLGLADAGLLTNPNFVLDPNEIAAIQQRIDVFNEIIAEEAAAVGAPVVDLAAIFDDVRQNGYDLFGYTLTNDYLGGIFTLDGVHPGNTGHAIISNAYIQALNSFYGLAIPELSPLHLGLTLFFDPHVDKDRDGRVTGRALTGLLETVGPAVGVSGDPNDLVADAPLTLTQEGGRAFVRQVEGLTGVRSSRKAMRQRALDAAASALGQR